MPALYGAHAAFLAGLILLYLVFGTGTRNDNHSQDQTGILKEARKAWSSQFKVYASPTKALPGLVFFWHTLMFVALLTFLPGFAADSATQRFLATVLPIATILGSFTGGAIAQRLNNPRQLMAGALLAFAALAVMLAISLNGGLFPSAACLTMFVSGIIQASAFSAIPQLCKSESDQAQANGAVTQLGNLGATCGTPLFALAMSLAGIGAVPLLAAGLSGCALVMLALIGHRVTRTDT